MVAARERFAAPLGVDVPRPTDSGATSSAARATAARAGRTRVLRLLAGMVVIRRGHRGVLRLNISTVGRKVIRQLQHAGIKQLRAVAIVTGTITPGRPSVHKVNVMLRLQ